MITLDKLHIFKRFGGDLDGLRRTGNEDTYNINSHDWFVIGNLIQDIRLVNKDLAAASYAVKVTEELKAACEDEDTINELKEMAK